MYKSFPTGLGGDNWGYEGNDRDCKDRVREHRPICHRNDPEIGAWLSEIQPTQWKYRSGAFAWAKVPGASKPPMSEVIDVIQQALTPGLEPWAVYTVVVEHETAGKFELHKRDVMLDLVRGRHFQPYYPERDRNLLVTLDQVICQRFGLPWSRDPSRRRWIGVSYRGSLGADRELLHDLDAKLKLAFAGFAPENREQVIERLAEVGIVVRERKSMHLVVESGRLGKCYLSGPYCHEAFTGPAYVVGIAEADRGRLEKASAPGTAEQRLSRLVDWRREHVCAPLLTKSPAPLCDLEDWTRLPEVARLLQLSQAGEEAGTAGGLQSAADTVRVCLRALRAHLRVAGVTKPAAASIRATESAQANDIYERIGTSIVRPGDNKARRLRAAVGGVERCLAAVAGTLGAVGAACAESRRPAGEDRRSPGQLDEPNRGPGATCPGRAMERRAADRPDLDLGGGFGRRGRELVEAAAKLRRQSGEAPPRLGPVGGGWFDARKTRRARRETWVHCQPRSLRS